MLRARCLDAIRWGALALATGLLAAPVAGQVPDSTRGPRVYQMPDLRARAVRPVTTVGGTSGLEVAIDSMRLPPAPTLEFVLRELPTVHVRTNSRGEAELSVRGSESRQTAILIDDIPITLGWDGRTDASVIPATAPKRISVVRGLSSLLYGPNVLGGVIEMDVADDPTAPDRTTVRVTGGVDHVGGFGTSGTLEVPIETGDGGWLLRGGVGYRDSPGQPLASGVTEPVPTEDDLRLNTDVDQIDGFFSTRYGSDGGAWVSLMGTGFSAERGIAAELGVDDPRFWRYPEIRRTIAVASAGTGDRETPFGRGGISASFGYDDGRTEIESYTSRAYDEIESTEIGDDRTWTGRALGQHSIGDLASLRMAFTYADILRDQHTDGLLETFQQRLWSLGTEGNLRLVDDADAGLQSLQLTLGGAIDRASTPQSGGRPPLDPLTDWGGRAGLTGVLSDGNLLLHGGVSRRVRFPALRELYSEALGEFAPNPDLEPERLVALEVGSTMRVAEGEVQLVGFHHNLTGAIRRITLADGRRQRVNADRLRSTGIEILASQDFGPLSLTGDLTLQAVDLIDPNTSVSTEPENLPEVAGEIGAAILIGAGFSGTFEAQYTGTQYCQDPDTGADRELDDGTWLNAGLAKRFSLGRGQAGTISGLELSAFVRNLGDIELDDQCGLPRPGRLFGLQVSVF